MKTFYRICVATGILLLFASSGTLNAQGCIAIRNMSSCSAMVDTISSGFQFSMNYRYFRSFRHFRGTEEETRRVTEGTNVINNDNSWLLGVEYAANNRWSFSVTMPFLYIDRSSLYEHMGNSSGQRFHTHSQGLGDIRVVADYNLMPTNVKNRLSVGLGAKLPTGNYNYKDYFHTTDGLELRPVDQSIQPGDGGFGVVVEFDEGYLVGPHTQLYVNGVYMFNPRSTNGTVTRNGSELSVSDQYIARLGSRYTLKDAQFALGARVEGIPTHDVVGKSSGFRRPGYIYSLDPSVSYRLGNHAFALNVPVAIIRARTQNVDDIEKTGNTGTFSNGDAAFADYLISVAYSYRLPK